MQLGFYFTRFRNTSVLIVSYLSKKKIHLNVFRRIGNEKKEEETYYDNDGQQQGNCLANARITWIESESGSIYATLMAQYGSNVK